MHHQILTEDIYEITVKYLIVLQVKWKRNQIANALCMTYNFEDWDTTGILIYEVSNHLWDLFICNTLHEKTTPFQLLKKADKINFV